MKIIFLIIALISLLVTTGCEGENVIDSDETAVAQREPMVFSLSGDQAEVGIQVVNPQGILYGEQCFTSDAGQTYFTDEQSYSGGIAIKTSVPEGKTGFGSFGGVVSFQKLEGGRNLVKGDEVWIRTRLFIPSSYEYNSGRSKFIRFRTAHEDQNGDWISEGYNDLYLDGSTNPDSPEFQPYWFIYEGAQKWYRMGTKDDWLGSDRWRTIEMYLRLDNKTESEGGNSLVRVWIDGKLIGETSERRTLVHSYDFVYALYFFTYYGNETSPKTQSLYFDDLYFTTETPIHLDSNGYPCIGIE